MNIFLINPPYVKSKKIFMKEIGRCGSTASGNQYWPQTGLAYLAAIAEKYPDNNVKIIDAIAEELSIKETLEKIKNFNPQLIVVHTTTPTFNNDTFVLKKLKKAIKKCIFGFVGTHVANTPKESLENSEADFVLINEPEQTFEELLNNIDKDWKKITGLGYKKKNKIVINSLRPLTKNLDKLPFPARHLLPNHKYRMVLTNNHVFATIIPSRGCPHQCIYCRVGYPWGKRFRQRSIKNVVQEMKEVKTKYNIKNIVFMADTFTLDKKWVLDLCDKIIKENLNIKWMCNSRIDTVDEEMVIKMKKAGCFLISFGVESGSQKILDNVKKNIDLKKAKYAISITKKAGVKAFAYFVLGLPGETKETIKQTIKLAKDLNPDYVNFHIATPHPGTELQEIAEKNNWIIDYNYDHYDQSGNYSVMRNDDLTAKQILMAQKKAMKEFYLRPKIIISQIKKVRNPQDFIDMTKVALKIIK